jgi:predicted metal-dependent hydrolase
MNSESIVSVQHIILPGNPKITIILRRSKRAKRMSLRILRLKGIVTLSLPVSCQIREAEKFVFEKESWIRAHLADLPQSAEAAFGGMVLFQGELLTICRWQGRQVRKTGAKLLVPGADGMVTARVKAFLKLQARQRLAEATDRYSAALGKSYGKLTLRDTTSRWGSCSTKGNINYSWRLIMAPAEVLNYVAAHEVAHLVQMNHSPQFWAVVEHLYPAYATYRAWLKDHGEELHSYQF